MKQITFLLSVFLLPAAAVEAQDRSQLDQLMDPQLDNAARVDGERICFPYLRTGARPAEVCVPAVNFADTLTEVVDMSALTFAGNTLATSPADLARCYIRMNTDPGIDDRALNDPAISQQLSVTCPSRREGGGTYRLTVMFNRHYYLPLQLSDTVCGPDASVLGSEFDRYVRSSLGEPSQVETDQNTAKGYYWLNTSTTMALAPDSRGRQTACDSPTSTQLNWSGKIMLNNAVGDPWVAYLRTAAQRQRDGSFTRF
jgi:hypothetical protein